MNVKGMLRTLLIFTILGFNIGCDQVSKSIVRNRIGDDERIGVIDRYVTVMKVENKGAFLSLGSSLPKPLRILLLTILPVAVLGAALVYLLTKRDLSPLSILGICFVVGGGIGNIYDRIVHGSVTDFLHIDLGIVQTGIFNMADVSIMAGMLIVLLGSYFGDAKLKPNESDMQKY